MRKNFDPLVEMYIDDINCQACTFWDCCPRSYAACDKNREEYFAMSTWQNQEDLEEDVHNFDVGC